MKNVTTIPQVTNPKGFLPSLIDVLKSLMGSVFKFSSPLSGGKNDDGDVGGNPPKVTAVKVKISSDGGDELEMDTKEIVLITEDSVEAFKGYSVNLSIDYLLAGTPTKNTAGVVYPYSASSVASVKISNGKQTETSEVPCSFKVIS